RFGVSPESKGKPPQAAQPAEPVEPVEPQPAGAAASPPAPLGDRPGKPFVTTMEDDLHRIRQAQTSDKIEMVQKARQLPESIRNPEMQDKFYRHMEGDPDANLTPDELKLYEQHIIPLKKEERALYEEISKADFPTQEFDPE